MEGRFAIESVAQGSEGQEAGDSPTIPCPCTGASSHAFTHTNWCKRTCTLVFHMVVQKDLYTCDSLGVLMIVSNTLLNKDIRQPGAITSYLFLLFYI